jgi:tetratricopeptide (TPR) repeat protein
MQTRLLSAALLVVAAIYLFLGGMGDTDRGNAVAGDAPYNLLSRGLLSGHLYLAKEAPAFLATLGNPYDPAANAAARDPYGYHLSDLSYYRGRMYMYFGVAPALLVFIPWHLLTGHWLPQWMGVVLLCMAGLAVNLSTIGAVRARVFPGSAPWMPAVLALILGLASYAPLLLSSADMWEVPVAMGYFSAAVALRCLWQAYEHPQAPAKWLGLASAAFGVAFASRPNELPGALVLLLPFAIREIRVNPRAWAATIVPATLCGAGVALYNGARFGSPFEFGTRYMLVGARYILPHQFSAAYFWTNVHKYLFQRVDWSWVFPFTHESAVGTVPAGYAGTQHISGVLVENPVLWAVLAVPFFIKLRIPCRSFVLLCVSAAWVAFSSLFLLLFLVGANARYQLEFVPELALLAALGVLALEHVGPSGSPLLTRGIMAAALAYSCVFPILYGIERCVYGHNNDGTALIADGDLAGARREFEAALSLSPRNPVSRLSLGVLLVAQGRPAEALPGFEALTREFPDYPSAYLNLATALALSGRPDEAAVQYRNALRLDPGNAAARAGLDAALRRIQK